jgi:hypothetical protein
MEIRKWARNVAFARRAILGGARRQGSSSKEKVGAGHGLEEKL